VKFAALNPLLCPDGRTLFVLPPFFLADRSRILLEITLLGVSGNLYFFKIFFDDPDSVQTLSQNPSPGSLPRSHNGRLGTSDRLPEPDANFPFIVTFPWLAGASFVTAPFF